jgi:hypothetical protein
LPGELARADRHVEYGLSGLGGWQSKRWGALMAKLGPFGIRIDFVRLADASAGMLWKSPTERGVSYSISRTDLRPIFGRRFVVGQSSQVKASHSAVPLCRLFERRQGTLGNDLRYKLHTLVLISLCESVF